MALFSFLANREASYLRRSVKLSYRQMSQLTNIPRTILMGVGRGTVRLPTKYQSQLKNIYRRSAYQELRKHGFASHQARRFRMLTPEHVIMRSAEMDIVVSNITRDSISGYLKNKGVNISQDNILRHWSDAKKAILEAIGKSRKSWEEIKENY